MWPLSEQSADVGYGSEAPDDVRGPRCPLWAIDLHALIAFFRARRGAAVGFRLQDPFDHSSNGMTGEPGAADQMLGDGRRREDRVPADQGLWRTGPAHHPAGGGDGAGVGGRRGADERLDAWPTRAWSRSTRRRRRARRSAAGFRFDVPVRFAEDRLSLNRATFAAGEIPSVPLIEIRE